MSDEQLTQEGREALAEELDKKYDTGMGTFAVPEDEVNGMVGILEAAGVEYEHRPNLYSIYFNYPETVEGGNGGSDDA